MPEPIVAQPGATVRDNNGVEYPVYAGAERDPTLDQPIVGDRGDSLEAPAPVPPPVPPTPPAPETPPNPVAPETPPVPPETPPEGEEEPLRDEQGRFVPKGRFNEVNERMHAAEAEAKLLREQLAASRQPAAPAAPAAPEPEAPPAYDFDAKELEYINLVMDGKANEALALRKEIRAAESDVIRVQQREATTAVTSEQQLHNRIAEVASGYEERFPALKEGHADFDPELIKDVQAIYAGNLQTGRYSDTVDAWDKSIAAALRMRGIDPTAGLAPPAGDTPPPPAPPPTPPAAPTPKPGATSAPRQEALNSQPPNLASAGIPGGSEAIDVSKLSGDDFAKLPIETQKRLRGDFLT